MPQECGRAARRAGHWALALAVGLGTAVLGAPTAAHAAPVTITPELGYTSASNPPPQLGPTPYWTSYTVTDGGGLSPQVGSHWGGVTNFYEIPGGAHPASPDDPPNPPVTTNLTLSPLDPALVVPGYRVDPDYDGPVKVTVTKNATGNLRFDQNPTASFYPPTQAPSGTVVVNEGIWEQYNWATGPVALLPAQTSTTTYDFSQLPGGALPAGSLLRTFDVDACGTQTAESIAITSNVTSEFLDYKLIYLYGAQTTSPNVSFDPATGTYTQGVSTCANIDEASHFVTTTALSTLTVTMTSSNSRGWVYHSLALPTEQIPGTLTWTKTDPSAALLGGATFTLTGPSGPVVVADNGPLDANPANGKFEVRDLAWGEYSLVETTPPTGYTADDQTATAAITATELSADLGTFVNTPIPVTDPPVTDPPVTDPPVTTPPVTDPPVTDSPVTDPPVTTPPVAEPSPSDSPSAAPSVPSAPSKPTGPSKAAGPTVKTGGTGGANDSGSAWLWVGSALVLSGAAGVGAVAVRRRHG